MGFDEGVHRQFDRKSQSHKRVPLRLARAREVDRLGEYARRGG